MLYLIQLGGLQYCLEQTSSHLRLLSCTHACNLKTDLWTLIFFLIKTNTNVAHTHKKSTCNHAEKYSK